MANHSCSPNSALDYDYLRGSEGAPYAFLRATRDIEIGEEIETSYGYMNKYSDAQIHAILQGGRFIPCRCLKENCKKIFLPHCSD